MGVLMQKLLPLCCGIGTLPAEPFVDHDSKGVLVTSSSGMTLQLFGRQIGYGSALLSG